MYDRCTEYAPQLLAIVMLNILSDYSSFSSFLQ